MQNKERKGKWQPYDALVGFQKALRNSEFENEKIAKPILLPDKIEELNYRLQEAVLNQEEIRVVYYKNGQLHELFGIASINSIGTEVKIDNQKIKLNSIIDIQNVR